MTTAPSPIARLGCAAPRRVIATAVLGALGVFLLVLAVEQAGSGAWKTLVLALAGLGTLALTLLVWRATGSTVLLTEEALTTSEGTLLCPVSEIVAVESGFLAFRPANGFVLRLKSPAPRGFAPGLWWRFGRRLGVGGSVSAQEAKVMAQAISLQIAARAAPADAADPADPA
ncbi:hypothetical protein FDP22_00130 [Paroceanicella profunda]|uniref:PH domain-containing protein n=1 Tax=Paroceanicella profunda TaxID=2579971 RepID=A0A5B8FWG4_9RHOB|nr:hypothetical protein [Paroceanicella profunda]QDL90343.1 hypothetical protein FDP22_00130 [Paroceanicella profunda]